MVYFMESPIRMDDGWGTVTLKFIHVLDWDCPEIGGKPHISMDWFEQV